MHGCRGIGGRVPYQGPKFMLRIIVRTIESISTLLGYLGGTSFLILSFYMSWDVMGRKFGFPYSGVSDEISGYTLAAAGSLALAHALNSGAHVRIVVVSEVLPPGMQKVLRYGATVTMGIFAAFLAYYSWRLAASSAAIDARSISILRAPIAIPQAAMATGFTALALQAAVAVFLRPLSGMPEGRLPSEPSASDAEI